MKSIDDLRLEVEKSVTADDIIEAIIFKSGKTEIPKSPAFLQSVFHDLKEKFPDLFTGFIFDESGIIPFSDELDSVLFRLEASAILPTLNPTYKNYEVKDGANLLEASYKKFGNDKAKTIDKCAEIFSNLLAAEPK